MYVCIPDSKVQDSGFQKQKFPGLIFRNLHSLSKRWHLFCVTRALMCIYNFLAKNCWSFYWLSSRLGFHSKSTSMLKLMSIFIKKMCNHATNMTRDHHSVSVSKSHWFSSNSWQQLETKSTTCFRYLNVVMRRGNPVQGYWTY